MWTELYPCSSVSLGPPDLAGNTCHKLQLAALVFRRDTVPLHGGCETTLRTEGKALEWDETSGFFDTAEQLIGCFQSRLLGGDKTKDHESIPGHMPQRFKSSRACIVVFQQEALEVGQVKYSRNWLVITTGIEFALVVTATNVNSKGDSRVAANDGVVQLNAAIDEFIGVAPALAIPLAHLWIEESSILGSIDLNVGTA